jgi:hypothetical protein
MANPKKRTLTSAGVTLETLEETTRRALHMLVALATAPGPYALMCNRGYGPEEHARGWALVQRLVGMPAEGAVDRSEAARAAAELDDMDGDLIELIRSALTRHPDACDRILAGLEPATGADAVANAALIVERLDAESKTEEGRAALARLAKSKLGAKERADLAAMVAKTKVGAEDAKPSFRDSPEYLELLFELRDWYVEWSGIARLTIKRRDYLIRLGLATKRGKNDLDIVDPTPFIDPTEDPNL